MLGFWQGSVCAPRSHPTHANPRADPSPDTSADTYQHKGREETESLPAGAGRFVLLKILKYGIVRDVAAGGGEVAPSPEMPPPVALAQVRELHLHLMRAAPL